MPPDHDGTPPARATDFTGAPPGKSVQHGEALLIAVGALCLVPWKLVYPPLDRFHIELGLGAGIAFALLNLVHPGPRAKQLSRTLIQVCVVLLGFRMDLHALWAAGSRGLLFAVATIVATFALGWLLGRLL